MSRKKSTLSANIFLLDFFTYSDMIRVMFEERLKYLMKREGLSAKQLGKEIGLTDSAIYMMLNGGRKPSYESLTALCKILKTTPNYLCGFEDEISEQDRQLLQAFKAMATNTPNEAQAQNYSIQTQEKER